MLANGLLGSTAVRVALRRLSGQQLAGRCFLFDRPPPQSRSYADNQQPSYVQLPALSDHPPIIYPSLFKAVHSFVQVMFVIKPFLDKEFDMLEFLEGSKQAVATVSQALAREDYESLQGLVTEDAIQSLRHKIFNFSPEQKQLIAVEKDDIYAFSPYQVGIMFDNNKAEQKFVEITVIYYTLKGLRRIKEKQSEPSVYIGFNPELRKYTFICNYRFIREYTKGVDSSWTINMINHFMPDTL